MDTENGVPALSARQRQLAGLTPFLPGHQSNGSAPKGKRISTWMAEYSQMEDADLPKVGSKAWDKLPKGARIALRRLRAADQEEELGLANSKYVEPTALESGAGVGADSTAFIASLAAAIMAMKAAGVEFRAVEATDQRAGAIDAVAIKPGETNERE